ncbi:nucleoside phosphorylase domain-containing protein [Hygrophoropsis aurantiaca]|uniref:Nucleoside phosphorylase domain-containing protein n=1 Tax=Hygrophoropsis aurantiaca TaxID=72124 RepID=A0ACB8AJV4_9AGAM|nr:nucleoside phosphorylase domain-containing protein [Hygrophoropsis aurantiaca]
MSQNPTTPGPFAATLASLSRLVTDPRLQKPRIGIVCGSGLSTLVKSLKDVVEIPYTDLEGFATSTVSGHNSQLAFGLMGKDDVPVVAMLGRFHPYEGYKPITVTYGIRVMAKLGVKDIIITNAAGSLTPDIPVGTIVVIRDHFAIPNLTGMNPSFGPLMSPEYPRFLPLGDAYSTRLRRLAFLASHDLQFDSAALAEGTYAWVSGPAYETPAEGRFLRNAGAHVVGMSTIPEVVAAREEKMDVMVLSLVTNMVVIPDKYRSIKEEVEAELAGRPMKVPEIGTASHEEVLAVGRAKAEVMRTLVERIVERVPSESP